MRYILQTFTTACVLLCASLCLAQAPSQVIRLPSVTLPAPPAPPPNAATKLNDGVLYVIDCKTECVIRTHPAGMVSVSRKTGPRDISAVFVDGNGKTEDRTYSGPFIYFVRAVGTGRVEVDVIPLGLKSESEIVTAIIDANSGPQPPPDPGPPAPVPDALTQKFQAAFDRDRVAGIGNLDHVRKLAAVYRQGATWATTPPHGMLTIGMLYDRLQAESVAAGIPPKSQALTTLRDAIGAEIGPVLTIPTMSLEGDTARKAKEVFERVAKALEGVK